MRRVRRRRRRRIGGNLPAYTGTFEEFESMVLQFGYVALFAAAFPAASAMALASNLAAVRTGAYRMVKIFRRPIGEGAAGSARGSPCSSPSHSSRCSPTRRASHRIARGPRRKVPPPLRRHRPRPPPPPSSSCCARPRRPPPPPRPPPARRRARRGARRGGRGARRFETVTRREKSVLSASVPLAYDVARGVACEVERTSASAPPARASPVAQPLVADLVAAGGRALSAGAAPRARASPRWRTPSSPILLCGGRDSRARAPRRARGASPGFVADWLQARAACARAMRGRRERSLGLLHRAGRRLPLR